MAGLTKSKKTPQRSWRPDFRVVETLPDTKVIRTGFLLNFVAITLAAGALAAYGVKEYSLQNLVKEVNALEIQVKEGTPRNRQILDTNKRFRQSGEIVSEAVAFDSQPVKFHEAIADVSAVLPEGMILTAIQLQSSSEKPEKNKLPKFVIELSGRVLEGAPVTPAQLLKNYQSDLREMPCLSGKTVEMEMARFGRNNEFGHFDFTLLVKISVDKAPTL